MRKLHRNSQKRYYIDGAIYFITTNTYCRFPYFLEDILCELFIEELKLCKRLKKFQLYGYKINPDHIHLLIKPNIEFNFSKIIKSLKENFSRDANKLISFSKKIRIPEYTSDTSTCRLCIREFIRKKYYKIDIHNLPQFKWQKSFHYHIINNHIDFMNHMEYIKYQWIKHGLNKNKWCWVEYNN